MALETRHASSFERHRRLMQSYESSKQQAAHEDDHDILTKHHRFVHTPEELSAMQGSWETRMASKYYARLYKEYALADLTHYKQAKVGLRWRTEAEVVAGKGQFICGNVTKGPAPCPEREGLRSFEVNFSYVEHGEKRRELVKLRLCAACGRKLNHRGQEDEASRGSDHKRKRGGGEDSASAVSGEHGGHPPAQQRSDTGEQHAGGAAQSPVLTDIDPFLEGMFP